ncbi:enoyl-CoA hydratase/isomerase family protein [Rhodoferax mekongensis]|uniref:enoyl-CoA hydratase/isomerase family protein n=1 Tax=Rhodoferax mekongensis TaxID=3068341 RepID=UPI0028BD2E59|nr:enoyl-CoA hydratase/isomerase family protein [Rhodoferax sp. TBRC 17199]MDT7514005.1 enoyl-CoA hydratase/isomerase family protein [Rhodoferax sp. TBRC 17199]
MQEQDPISDELAMEQRAGVLWLTIQREERRNAMSHGVIAGMAQAIRAAQQQRDIRAIVITGAGPKAFCSGADLQASKVFTGNFSEPHAHLAQLLRAARASHIPLIARVNGFCLAGGMGLLSMCDMAVASTHATFGLPEVKVGVFPAQVLTVLQHLIPRRVLTEMCITGEPITSTQALTYGLVNHVADDVDEKLQWLLDRLLDKSPAAIRRGLYTMKSVETMAFEESMAFTESQIALFTLTEDAQEGQKAFQEKRKPVWTGQ